MISEKEYLKALETIKQYKKQLRIGVVVRSAVKKTKTVWLDDSWYGIQIDGEDTKADNQFLAFCKKLLRVLCCHIVLA